MAPPGAMKPCVPKTVIVSTAWLGDFFFFFFYLLGSVTYCSVQSSYTAGYLGTFITGAAVGAILASGTGYYYPPYYGYPVGGYPIYRPYAATYGVGSYYNTYSGAYGVARGVYGPYGGAAAGAAYNPYTGTYARGATAYGPYGSRSVAQAYNPYTGTYAATKQGSNAYSSWGQSVVSNGNKSAYTQHYSNANGTVGSIQGSQGGAAVGASTSTATPPRQRPPAVTCTPPTTATFTKTPVTVGAHTITATGTQ